MPAAGHNSLFGQTLAERYQVTAKLGVGGMGTVYKADDLKLQSEVVIKTPHATLIKDAEFAARFRREIRSLVQLSHPNIVKVMDVGVHDGLPFAVMQYLPGGSLDGRNRPCAPIEVLEWLGDIADALDFIHQQGLIHRDVKPANILFDESGRAYLGDFGIAKVVAASDESDQKQITGTGTMIGTAEFMAPEMLMPDLYSEEYDERVDQYALAVTVYEMLAGRPPFSGDTIATVAVKLAKTKAPLLHELRTGIPQKLSKVVARGLLKKPDRRYPNCRAFAEAITKTITKESGQTGGFTPVAPSETPHQGDRKTMPALRVRAVTQQETPRDSTVHYSTPVSQQHTVNERPPSQPASSHAIPSITLPPVRDEVFLPLGSDEPRLSSLFFKWLNSPAVISVTATGIIFLITIALAAKFFTNNSKVQNHNPVPDRRTVARSSAGTAGNLAAPTDAGISPSGNTDADSEEESSEPTSSNSEPPVSSRPVAAPLPSPPKAVAPFNAQRALELQQAWATHLGVPLESVNSIGMTFRVIPPGTFLMGSPPKEFERITAKAKKDKLADWYLKSLSDEGPQHDVTIAKPLLMGTHEVTRGQFNKFVRATFHETDAEARSGGFGRVNNKWVRAKQFVWQLDPGFNQTDQHPVVLVSWNDAVAFCKWLSEKEGEEYSLPTEAQWEFACRAGTTTEFSAGSVVRLGLCAWYGKKAGGTKLIGQKTANNFGLHDMHGNVWEWCQDWYDEDYYSQSLSLDPKGPTSGINRVLRGGSFFDISLSVRSANRHSFTPQTSYSIIGFRVVRAIKLKHSRMKPYEGALSDSTLANTEARSIDMQRQLDSIVDSAKSPLSEKLPSGAIFVTSFESNAVTTDHDLMFAADLSGQKNHAELVGPKTGVGKVGQALVFSGDDEFVQTPVAQSECSTIVMWLNVAAFDKPIHHVQGANDGVGFSMFIDDHETARFRFGDGEYHDTKVPHGLLAEKWHHMAIVIERETSRLRYYLGGVLVHLGPIPKNVRFGDRKLSLGHTGVQSVRRSIDEFAIFNRVLSEAEIKAIREMGLAGEALGTVEQTGSKVTPPPEKKKRKVVRPKF